MIAIAKKAQENKKVQSFINRFGLVHYGTAAGDVDWFELGHELELDKILWESETPLTKDEEAAATAAFEKKKKECVAAYMELREGGVQGTVKWADVEKEIEALHSVFYAKARYGAGQGRGQD